ncbi:MAG: xanthine dehydrogenase family protein [Nocardioidaceae bacterium]|nr:MAG: xanthine dehydrogenase family protein [Nocardioidaceae bacterium]
MGSVKREGRQGMVGSRQMRAEDPRLLTGRGRFVADVKLPGMLEAAFLRSSVAHARIRALDCDFALGIDGVETVLVASDFAGIELFSQRHPNLLHTPQTPLAEGKVRFVGEAVAMVVATERYVAEDALEEIAVDYEELPAIGPATPTTVSGFEPVFDTIPDNVVFRDTQTYGNPNRAFADAAHVVRHSLDFARLTACPMEPRGCVADYDPATGMLTLHAATQAPHRLRRDLAAVLGLAEHQVKVMMVDIGGAFGQKIPTHMEEVAVARAAMLLGRPVRWIEDRQENLTCAPHSRGQLIDLELALDEDGRFTGMRATLRGDAGAYSFNSGSCLTESYRSARALPGLYDFTNFSYDVEIKLTNRSPVAPYRGVGFVAAQAARELLIDKAATQVGIDRFELRRLNMVPTSRLPYRTCTGWQFNEGTFTEAFETSLKMLAGGADDGPAPGYRRGVGISPFVEPSGIGSQGGVEVHGFNSPSHDAARVALDTHGKATVSFGTPSIGQGLETAISQLVAEGLGVGIDDVTVIWGDTSNSPMSLTGTRASRAATITGGAAWRAAEEVRAQVAEVAAILLGVSADKIEVEDGQVFVSGDPVPRLSVAEVAWSGFFDEQTRDPGRERTFEATRMFDPPASYSNACVIAVVDVEERTGAVTVQRIIGVEDCGTMINPMIVDGQFIGGAAQAIGGALYEQVHYGETQQPATATLMDYLVPTATDTVRVELQHFESEVKHTVRGIKGMGESGVIGTVAALACAVADAVTWPAADRIERLPLLPEVVWQLLREPESEMGKVESG